MVVGWGIPAALVSICVGFKYEEYGGEVCFPTILRVKVVWFLVEMTVEYSIRIEYLINVSSYSIIAGSVQTLVFSTFN